MTKLNTFIQHAEKNFKAHCTKLLCALEIRNISLKARTSGLVISFANPHNANNDVTRINGTTKCFGTTASWDVVVAAFVFCMSNLLNNHQSNTHASTGQIPGLATALCCNKPDTTRDRRDATFHNLWQLMQTPDSSASNSNTHAVLLFVSYIE